MSSISSSSDSQSTTSIPLLPSASTSISMPSSSWPTLTYKELDNLFCGPNAFEAYDILKNRYTDGDHTIPVLWRLARYCHKAADGLETDKEKYLMLREGLDYAEEAYRDDHTDHSAAKWCALLSGKLKDYLNPWAKVRMNEQYRRYLSRAIQIKPEVTLLHLRGVWNYEAASLSLWERQKYIALLCRPPVATFWNAVSDFKEAAEMNQYFLENQAYLGLSYYKINQAIKGQRHLRVARTMPENTPERIALAAEVEKVWKSL